MNFTSNFYYGKMYVVDDLKKVRMLKSAFQGKKIDEILLIYGQAWEEFLIEIAETGTIQISDDPFCYKDELTYGGRIAQFHSRITKKFPIKKMYLEIDSKCNKNCDFCISEPLFKCKSCFKRNIENSKVVKNQDLLDGIEQMLDIGLEEIVFLGEDPLTNITLLEQIQKRVREVNPRIKITINSSLSNADDIVMDYLKKNELCLNYQNTHGDQDLAILSKLVQNEINFGVSIREYNQEKIVKFCNNNNISYVFNVVANEQINFESSLATKQDLIREFTLGKKTSSKASINCIFGNVYIDLCGNISACPYGKTLGIINELANEDILYKLSDEWCQAKNEAERCIHCIVRDFCQSCTYLNQKHRDKNCHLSNTKVF